MDQASISTAVAIAVVAYNVVKFIRRKKGEADKAKLSFDEVVSLLPTLASRVKEVHEAVDAVDTTEQRKRRKEAVSKLQEILSDNALTD